MNDVGGFWLAVAAVILSMATLVTSGIGMRNRARTTYVDMLEKRVAALTSEVDRLQRRCDDYERDNARLLRENMDLLRRFSQAGS